MLLMIAKNDKGRLKGIRQQCNSSLQGPVVVCRAEIIQYQIENKAQLL